MRGANDVALEFFAKDPRVAALDACGHRLTDKRECLMAIESAQFQMLAVQKETVRSEARLAKADTSFVLIDDSTTFGQLDVNVVQLRLIDAPQFDCTEIVEC